MTIRALMVVVTAAALLAGYPVVGLSDGQKMQPRPSPAVPSSWGPRSRTTTVLRTRSAWVISSWIAGR